MKLHTLHLGLLGLLLSTLSPKAADLLDLDTELTKTWPNNRTINIVFHGHSVPSGYQRAGEVKPLEAYPFLFGQQLKQRYPNAVVNIVTTSIGGENSIAGAARFSNDVFAQQPDLILIDYAINDRAQALPAVEAAWQSMIDEAQTAGVPVMLITPTGVAGEDLSNPANPLTERANLIRSLAVSEDVLIADVSAAWLAETTSGTPESSLLSQGNHPNLTGNQLAADTIWNAFEAATTRSSTTLLATQFPSDGSTATFTSPDSLVTFTTSNFFAVNGDFVGDGANAKPFSWDSNETLSIHFESGVGLTGFAVRWTRTDIVITGFTENPLAAIAGGTATWNDTTKTLTLDMPWDAGNGRIITFDNPTASDGQTLNFAFTDTQVGWQTSFTSFTYNSASTPTPTPLVRYSFDNGTVSGTSVTDLSGNGHNGTIIPSPSAPVTGEAGLFGESFRFLAGDSPLGAVQVPTSVIPSGSNPRTISLWFNQANEANQDKLFGYGTNTSGRAIDLGLEGGGIRIRHWGGNITYGSGFDFVGNNAGWHHLALRVNDSAATFADVDVFLDGTKLAPLAGGATGITLNTANGPLAIGDTATPNSAAGFDGRIDEFQAWDSALTTSQIKTLAVAPPVPKILSFKASPQNRVPSGSPVTLSWTVENTTTLTLDPGGIDVTGTGSYVVNPTAKTTYTLTASDGSNPDAISEVILNVGAEPYPNIIVFFLDDFGWADWEQNGAPTGSNFYETPNMNRLASQGLYFPNGYASTPVCSPTRGALMTGQAPAFNKLTDWITGSGDNGQPVREAEWVQRLNTTIPSFPRVFADCGYRSIHVGKWHLGSGTEPEANPLNHGFQVNIGGNQFGTPPAPERYFASASGFSGLPNMGPAIAPQGSYLTDVLTEQAVAQIQSAARDDAAFSMFLSHYAVHTPIQAPAATVAKYQAKLDANPGMDWRGQTNPTYAAMIEHVDLSLGAIMDTLADPDGNPNTDDSIAENTLIIFTADNGGLLSSTSNRPLRDGKGGNYDGGTREPWVFWMPGTIAPGIQEEVIVTHDVFPTILSMADIPNPAGHEVNGQDLSPLLKGEPFTREKPLTFHYPHWSPQGGSPYSAIRRGDWKAIYLYETKSWELYNLKADPGETNNLITAENDRLGLMSWLLADHLQELDANYPRNLQTLAEEPPLPLLNPATDSDGDGQNDLEEAIQGTDRNNPADSLKPEGTIEEGAFNMSFPAQPGRFYQLQASETLLPDDWTVIREHLPSTTPAPVTLTDESRFFRRFYRLAVQLP